MSVVAPEPPLSAQIASPRLMPDGRFAFRLQGTPGTSYEIEYSSDLVRWQTLRVGVIENDGDEVVDSEAGMTATRFYRLRP